MAPESLPTVGLGEYYLASTPMRHANQCTVASIVVMTALSSFGLEAEPVALMLDVDDGNGGTMRYGEERPRIEGGEVVGHVGLIADGRFLDVTAAQFPEIVKHGGIRVVSGDLRGNAAEALQRGALLPTILADRHVVQYTVLPLGSADPALLPTMEEEGTTLAIHANNLRLPYLKVLSLTPFVERVQTLTQPRYARFVQSVLDMRDKEIEMVDGIFKVRD